MQTTSGQTLQLSDKDLFLNELRAVTGPAHKKLEETALSKVMVSDRLDLYNYVLYLCKIKSVVAYFEKEVYPLLKPVIKDIDQRHKASLIEKDLDFLRERQVPVCTTNFSGFASTSLSYLLGCMYILEGSTLNGKFIFKNAESILSLNEVLGASYFHGYGIDTGKLWISFLAQFSDYAVNSGEKELIIQGANDLFECLFDLFNS